MHKQEKSRLGASQISEDTKFNLCNQSDPNEAPWTRFDERAVEEQSPIQMTENK